MRHRIRDITNAVIEVGAELAWDLLWRHVARRTGHTALEAEVRMDVSLLNERVDRLERHISQAELRPRARRA